MTVRPPQDDVVVRVGPVDTWRWVGPVLLVLAVTTVLVGALAGPVAVLRSGAVGLADAALTLAVAGPLLAVALWRRPGALRVVAVLAVMITCSRWALGLPEVFGTGLDWNWQGKTVEVLWLAALFLALGPWAREEAGLGLRPRPGWRAAGWVVVGLFAGFALLSLWNLADAGAPPDPMDTERFLFDVGHANLGEELLVRGAMLAVLDRACGTPWRFLGADVGWGLVLTTVWFGLWHGLVLTADGLVVDPVAVLSTGLVGLLLGWIQARSGSVWLAYAAHCAIEVGQDTGVMAWALLGGNAPLG